MPKIPLKQKRRGYMPVKKRFNMSKPNMQFYNSKKWQNTRKAYYSQNPLCEACKENDLIVAGEVVDHIKEINDGGARFDFENLKTLCHPCHNSKSGKRGAEITNEKK